MTLDDIDKAMLGVLQVHGDISNVELAKRVNLSQPATHARRRRLEEQGYIRGYVALVDREKAGFDLLCFIHITMQMNQQDQIQKYMDEIKVMPEVLECHHITGEYDYLLKAVVRNRHELERFVNGKLTALPGIARIQPGVYRGEIDHGAAADYDDRRWTTDHRERITVVDRRWSVVSYKLKKGKPKQVSNSFMTSKQLFFTSESVTEGHPDKMCDQISDAVLDACLAQDSLSRVACETAVKTGFVLCLGEITTKAKVNWESLVRGVVNDIGFNHSDKGFDGNTCGVMIALAAQSPDIAQGVDSAFEVRGRNGTRKAKPDREAQIAAVGAGDQGMMFGFACNETPEFMPMPIAMAHRLARQLSLVRKNGKLPWLRPDGKTQVTVEYSGGKPVRISTVLISTQHAPEVDQEEINEALVKHVMTPVLPKNLFNEDSTKIYTNPTGRFVVGGPMGDAGLTGRKIIVDTYGGMGRHGGGAFSGKDPTKVDRSAAYAARWVAKNVVAAGLADRCEVQVAYAIGVAKPLSINVETFGTGKVSDDTLVAAINAVFDLRPGAIIADLKLRRPIYRQTAAYGHFGRTDIELPWEQTNRAAALKRAARN